MGNMQKAGVSGTMRDAVNPALADDLQEVQAVNGDSVGVEDLPPVEDEPTDEEEKDDVPEEEKDDEEDILDEHEPDVTQKVRRADGTVVEYTIKEMGKGKMTEWMKIWAARTRKKNVPESDEEFDKFLLAMITRAVHGPDGKLVTYGHAKQWGHRLKFIMFNKAQEVNGLTDKVVKREGKG